jgi:cell division protein FtsB
MNYKEKYLKYKTKYLGIRGGGDEEVKEAIEEVLPKEIGNVVGEYARSVTNDAIKIINDLKDINAIFILDCENETNIITRKNKDEFTINTKTKPKVKQPKETTKLVENVKNLNEMITELKGNLKNEIKIIDMDYIKNLLINCVELKIIINKYNNKELSNLSVNVPLDDYFKQYNQMKKEVNENQIIFTSN